VSSALAAAVDKVAEDLTLVEDDVERLLKSNKKLARAQAAQDEKVSAFIIEYRKASREVSDILTLHGRLLQDALEKLRTPK
jgi:ABC-type transporter Mla subunit MlaD